MRSKRYVVMISIFILLIVLGLIYFIVRKDSNDIEENQEINYETISMITNLRLGISDFDSIHPYVTSNREVIYINQLIFEPLLTISEDYHIETCLAKEWSRIDGKTYIIKLNESVKWSNGNEFYSEDVKFSVETLQQYQDSIYYENIKNIEKIEIIDNYTIRIELKEEEPFFEYNLIFPIISSKQYSKKDIKDSKIVPVGTGKYKINKIDNDKIELTKNEEWRNIDTENINIKTIYINLYDTMGKVYNGFKLGSIDLIHTANNNLEEYVGSLGYSKKAYSNREYDYLALNCVDSVLKFKEVRQAINTVIDQQKIATSILENNATAANYPLAYNYYLIEESSYYNISDAEKAKEILQNAGWSYEYGIWQKEVDGITKTINITLTVSKNNEQRIKVANEIKSQLEAIGIRIDIEQVSDAKYKNCIENHDYEMILTGVYLALSPDLTSFIGENNIANYRNEEIFSILNEVNNITENDLRKEKYKRIFEIYDDEVPYIGLYYNHDVIAYSTTMRGDIKPNCYSIFYNFSNWYRE